MRYEDERSDNLGRIGDTPGPLETSERRLSAHQD